MRNVVELNRLMLIGLLLVLLGACAPAAPVVVTVYVITPTGAAAPVVITATPAPIIVTATPQPSTSTPVIITATPAPIIVTATQLAQDNPTPTQENCYEDCTILANSRLQTPCYDTTVATRAMQVPGDWQYVWNPVVQGVPAKDLGNVPPFLRCDGFGVTYNSSSINGVFGLETAFDADKGTKYLIKVQYSAQCINLETSPSVFNIGGEIVNSDGGTTTKLTPQGLTVFRDKTPSAGEALWLVQSLRTNPGGVLKIYFTLPYGVCRDGSFMKLNAIYMFPVNWTDAATQF